MTKEQGGQKNGIVKANKKHIFHSPRGFFSLKKHFQKKFREGGRKSKGNTQNRYKKKREGGGSDKDGDTQTETAHTTHAFPPWGQKVLLLRSLLNKQTPPSRPLTRPCYPKDKIGDKATATT